MAGPKTTIPAIGIKVTVEQQGLELTTPPNEKNTDKYKMGSLECRTIPSGDHFICESVEENGIKFIFDFSPLTGIRYGFKVVDF